MKPNGFSTNKFPLPLFYPGDPSPDGSLFYSPCTRYGHTQFSVYFLPLNDLLLGILLSLATAFLWALSPLFWSSAGRRIGSYQVNLLRLLLAGVTLLLGLGIYVLLQGNQVHWPSWSQTAWLVLSGISGLLIGDGVSYEAILLLGARRMVQISTTAPVAAVLLAWLWMGESLNLQTLCGVALVLAAIVYITYAERKATQPPGSTTSSDTTPATPREPGHMSYLGLCLALCGAVFMGLGGVLIRLANLQGPLDPFIATVVRVSSSSLLIWLWPIFRRQTAQPLSHLRNRAVMLRILGGTLSGPLIGMVCYVAAFRFASAGVVSTVTAMSPLFIMPIVALKYHTRPGIFVYAATLLALAGVALIALH